MGVIGSVDDEHLATAVLDELFTSRPLRACGVRVVGR
jgi:hypothetical protein